MKKILSFMAMSLLILTLSACGKKAEEPAKTTTTPTPVVNETAEPADSGVISSIKEALTGSTTLKCDYTDEDGTKSTVHLKGKMVLIESITKGTETIKVNGLVRDNKMYVWSGQSTDGFLIDFSKVQPDDNTMKMGDTQINSSDDVVSELEKKKENCQKESLPDSAFEIPTGIKWVGDLAQ